jgi:hypothetical protein
VRGTFVRAVNRWIERTFGAEARDNVLTLLPPEHADALRTDAFNALVWYDLDAVDMLMEATTAALFDGEVAQWRRRAREHNERDLGPILRPGARLGDPDALIKRSASGWARIFDFGVMKQGTPQDGRMLVRVEGFEAASLAMRYAVIGTMESLLESAGVRDAVIRVVLGETSFARDFEYEVSWRV